MALQLKNISTGVGAGQVLEFTDDGIMASLFSQCFVCTR